jgi:threonine/homoserine/homoserine lactone efflux protein
MFTATLIVGCVWNFIAKDPVSALLTTSALLHRALEAVIAGFLIYLLFLVLKRKYPG